jgi:hypothetical protein
MIAVFWDDRLSFQKILWNFGMIVQNYIRYLPKKECTFSPTSQHQSASLNSIFETPTYVRISFILLCLLEELVLSMYSILTRQSSSYLRNIRFLISCNFGVIVLSWNDHITFVMSVRLSFRLYTTSGRISVKFDIGHFYENLSIISTHVSNLIKISRTLHYNLRILLRYYYCRRWPKFAIEIFLCIFGPLAKFRKSTFI